jgi:hypothetical protein
MQGSYLLEGVALNKQDKVGLLEEAERTELSQLLMKIFLVRQK